VASVLDPTSIDVPEHLHEQAMGSASTWRSNAQGTRRLRQRSTHFGVAAPSRDRAVRQRGIHRPMLWALNDLTIVDVVLLGVNDRIAAQIAAGDLPSSASLPASS
jgi:hypothetical protein